MVYLYFLDDLDVCNVSRSVVTFDSWGYVSINYLVSNVYANQFKWRTHLLITPNHSNASRPIQSKNNTMRENPVRQTPYSQFPNPSIYFKISPHNTSSGFNALNNSISNLPLSSTNKQAILSIAMTLNTVEI